MKLKILVTIALFGAFLATPALGSQFERTWKFSVLLDGSEIGYHTFRVTGDGTEKRVSSEARFDVKFLFINAFRYRHVNDERWINDCLYELDASTDSNGKRFEINGEATPGGFVVEANSQEDRLPRCVMTFAYWNPDFLLEERLLNPQSGEYLDVQVEELQPQSIEVRGEKVPAQVFSVSSKETDLTLWYSEEGEWLALESLAKGGRVIRYELT